MMMMITMMEIQLKTIKIMQERETKESAQKYEK